MIEKPARTAFLLSLLLLALVGLSVSSLTTNDKQLSTTVLNQGQVLEGSSPPTYFYKFYLKDTSKQTLGAVVLSNNEQVDTGAITGASVSVLNPGTFTCGDSGSD